MCGAGAAPEAPLHPSWIHIGYVVTRMTYSLLPLYFEMISSAIDFGTSS